MFRNPIRGDGLEKETFGEHSYKREKGCQMFRNPIRGDGLEKETFGEHSYKRQATPQRA